MLFFIDNGARCLGNVTNIQDHKNDYAGCGFEVFTKDISYWPSLYAWNQGWWALVCPD